MITPRMTRPWWPVALSIPLLGLGCGGSLPAAADPAQARQLLQTTLESWKQGRSPDALASQTPPIRVIDRDWGEGFQVVDYQFDGDGKMLGLNLQCPVQLTLKDPKGKSIKKKVVYVVSAGESPVVSRQDGDF